MSPYIPCPAGGNGIIRYSSGVPFPIGGGGVYADPAGIFLAENPIFQKKNAFLADFAARLSAIIKQNLGGCQGGKPFRFSIPAKGRDAVGSILRIEAPRLFEGGTVPLRQLLRSRRLSCNNNTAVPASPSFQQPRSLHSVQNATAPAAATLRESTPWAMGMRAV